MAAIARSLFVTTLTVLFVFTGAASRAAAAPPAGVATAAGGSDDAAIRVAEAPSTGAGAAAAAPAGTTAGEGLPTWAKWTLAGVAIAAGLALLLAFVIVPAAVEDSVENVDPCCGNGGGNGGVP